MARVHSTRCFGVLSQSCATCSFLDLHRPSSTSGRAALLVVQHCSLDLQTELYSAGISTTLSPGCPDELLTTAIGSHMNRCPQSRTVGGVAIESIARSHDAFTLTLRCDHDICMTGDEILYCRKYSALGAFVLFVAADVHREKTDTTICVEHNILRGGAMFEATMAIV